MKGVKKQGSPPPTSAGTQTPHTKVGIFWYVDGVVIGDTAPQEEAEPYGDALQYGGHYDFWEGLVPGTVQERTFKSYAYDYYPRGRMVLFAKRQTVRLYVDRCMDDDVINATLAFFENVATGITWSEFPIPVSGRLYSTCGRAI